MKYKEFLLNLSEEDLAETIATDAIFNAACVDNFNFEEDKCPHNFQNCKDCILKLLQSEVEECNER